MRGSAALHIDCNVHAYSTRVYARTACVHAPRACGCNRYACMRAHACAPVRSQKLLVNSAAEVRGKTPKRLAGAAAESSTAVYAYVCATLMWGICGGGAAVESSTAVYVRAYVRLMWGIRVCIRLCCGVCVGWSVCIYMWLMWGI